MPIRSFRDVRLAVLWRERRISKGFPSELATMVLRRLTALHDADALDELRFPPGNRLHALKDDRGGQHAIRVNDQYRLVFVWTDEGAAEVELVDYH
jgi:proteic killer suppression protein